MTRIPEKDRDIIETAMYLPMLLIVLERDLFIINNSPFKLPRPYLELIELTIKAVQADLKIAKDFLRKEQIKIAEIQRDSNFTMYSFIYKGFEERHNYFNPRLRNKTEELLLHYLHTKK